ncbi:sigma-54 dependent transcriptional regulator [Coralloluteibacterium stylophorae]|uniref:Sigma-54-dependent Fis family transcriptional regulator n=1 Tax=Coralloluteibacterium stylophorae TaxID=1776034 RepID=A0A8J7VUN6_9GAMM|nr:sigma-54 dependent transcriptional regulator [Coralloluteibacterium stylophorae]MBS7457214.1 sigma-54-dependent Fis family transcriptional regulator [Coralloluteibacterium stylophorae]
MSESRVLVVDAEAARAEKTAALLEFMDLSPVIVGGVDEIRIERQAQTDWLAIVVGALEDFDAWRSFTAWLTREPLHPPLLVLPDEQEDAARRFGVHGAQIWPLEYPIRHAQLEEHLRRASIKRMSEEERPAPTPQFGPTGSSAAVKRLRQMIEQVAGFDTTVLITGESGTGKEVAARAVHERSQRRKGPFVAINCGAIPPDLLESELFGHEKGAFTGALTARKGRFEMADGGTLLLDEIGDMPHPMQVKLLRVLQERRFERVGGNQTISVDVRVVAATHRNLEDSIARGAFREDLFYRLNVFPIEMPALRERTDDLPELIRAITDQLGRSGRGEVRLADDAIRTLQAYPWPGNVRELTNLIERLSVLHPGGTVRAADLPGRYRVEVPPAPAGASAPGAGVPTELPAEGIDLREHLARIELDFIHAALERANGVVAHAAQLLGLRRTTLVEKLRKYGIERDAA